jgi:hypothetical protein
MSPSLPQLRSCLSNLAAQAAADGNLSIHFPGCLAAAAPFLLFRLKRTGFSACRAVVTSSGLTLTARR